MTATLDQLEESAARQAADLQELADVVAQVVAAVVELERRAARRGPRASHREFMAQRAARAARGGE